MKIGLSLREGFTLSSVRFVAQNLVALLSEKHALHYLPPDYAYCSEERQRQLAEELVERCEVIVGFHDTLGSVLAARQRLGSPARCVLFLLGALPRGGPTLRRIAASLTTADVLIANCTADVELTRKFFSNAQVRLVPFAVDETAFYPLSNLERRSIRRALGFVDQDQILLYSGRVTAEKNLHTLLRIFHEVYRLIPHTHLLIVGSVLPKGFPEFGVQPLHLSSTLEKIIAKFNLPNGQVRLIDSASTERLRELYNIADIKVNMTLHHDENFGLAQVEAMACGTPVVGTAWGGLKDTILHGVTGHQVSTVMTPIGIKVDWWGAVNSIVRLLRDQSERMCVQDNCLQHAKRYTRVRYSNDLGKALQAAMSRASGEIESLQITDLAREIWTGYLPGMPHRSGHRSLELYQNLLKPFTGVTSDYVPSGTALEQEQVLTLATPVAYDGGRIIRVDDPLYPFEVEVPEVHRAATEGILVALRAEPAMTVRRVMETHPEPVVSTEHALTWMLGIGLLLRSNAVQGWLAPQEISREMSEVLFSFQRIDRTCTDFAVLL